MPIEVLLSISDIERETGISRDTLRVWEKRYGFPKPLRNQRSERTYMLDQLERLRLIKQLLDSGIRPGKLAGLELQQLRQMTVKRQETAAVPADVKTLLALLGNGSHAELRIRFETLLQNYGLRTFLTTVVAPMNHAVGEAWFDGRIGILDEHRYAELIRMVLTNALHTTQQSTGARKVLLTTMPGEQHGIGLLMAACLFALEGTETVLLGVQTPLEEIVRGAIESRCSIVAISCSTHISRRTLATQLVRLRKQLPEDILLWVGGGGTSELRTIPSGVQVFHNLNQIQTALSTLDSRSEPPPCHSLKQHTGT